METFEEQEHRIHHDERGGEVVSVSDHCQSCLCRSYARHSPENGQSEQRFGKEHPQSFEQVLNVSACHVHRQTPSHFILERAELSKEYLLDHDSETDHVEQGKVGKNLRGQRRSFALAVWCLSEMLKAAATRPTVYPP